MHIVDFAFSLYARLRPGWKAALTAACLVAFTVIGLRLILL